MNSEHTSASSPDQVSSVGQRAPISRRDAVAALGAIGLAAVAAPVLAGARQGGGGPAVGGGGGAKAVSWPFSPEMLGWDDAKGEFTLPPLPYAAAALEPHIDAATVTLHHTKHHAAYVAGLNKALGELKKLRDGTGEPGLYRHWTRELAFHGAGHANHVLYWNCMGAAGAGVGGKPAGELAAAIERDFGSFEKFSAQFRGTANSVEGNGWAWVVVHPGMGGPSAKGGRLMVMASEKQQDLFVWGVVPILGVDVWEHAYYLKYQNKRAEYTAAFMNVINWNNVGAMFVSATGHG